MRIIVTALLFACLVGCGTQEAKQVIVPPEPVAKAGNPVEPIVVGQEKPRAEKSNEVYIDAAHGTLRFGKVSLKVQGVANILLEEFGIEATSIGIEVSVDEGFETNVLGWGSDFELVQNLSGKKIDTTKGTIPLPIRDLRMRDEQEKTRRPLMRTLSASWKSVPVGTKEMRITSGHTVTVLTHFERVSKDARELFFEFPGKSFGVTSAVRLKYPANRIKN
jgi:hypothetical protein